MCNDSYKKHYTQMTNKEIEYIRSLIDDKKIHRFTKHMINKKNMRNIKEKDILRVFSNYEIIEFHKKRKDCRALIRGNVVCDKRNICISVNLHTGDIITVYSNDSKDNHKTIDMDNYNLGNVNLIDYIKLSILKGC